MNNLDIVKRTRKISADSLFTVFKNVLSTTKQISEAQFRDLWLKELRIYKEIFPNGWYDPPPFGIVVLFAAPKDKRADFVNLRPKEFWPRDDIFLDRKEGYLYLFASPVDRKTAITGDFGINIYFGKDEKVIEHLTHSSEIDRKIFGFAQVDMTSTDVFNFAEKEITRSGLRINIRSVTGRNNFNTGHTIPFAFEDLIADEKKTLLASEKNWNGVKTMISTKRKFVMLDESWKIKPGMAFTIEPGLKIEKDISIPMTMLHHTAIFYKDGSKELLTNFDEIFKLVGMDYML